MGSLLDGVVVTNVAVQERFLELGVAGMDVDCEEPQGSGRKLLLVLCILQQIRRSIQGKTQVLVLCHNLDLAFEV